MSNRPLDREPLPWQSPQYSHEPHTTLNRPGTRHTVFTVENREREGTGTNGNEELTQQKKAATLHHAEMCFKATTEKTQSMCRALLSLTAFYKKECVDYIILF